MTIEITQGPTSTGQNMTKTRMIFSQARKGTCQLIWDQCIIITDKNNNELSYIDNSPIANITLHKAGHTNTKSGKWSRKSFMWEVQILNTLETLTKTFYSRKAAYDFILKSLELS